MSRPCARGRGSVGRGLQSLRRPGACRPRPPGAIAQLGERLDRTQEVGGSSPPSSIERTLAPAGVLSFPRSGVLVDLLATRGEDVPLGAELVEALAVRCASLRVARVVVERVAVVGDLGL